MARLVGVAAIAALLVSCGDDPTPTYVCPDIERPSYPDLGWVYVPPGTFTMGSNRFEDYGEDPEVYTPHEVTLTRGFYMMQVETPTGLFASMTGLSSQLHLERPGEPATNMFFEDALLFANALSREHGLPECYDLSTCWSPTSPWYGCPPDLEVDLDCAGYRLPTEAEWEYAARAGTTAVAYWGNDYHYADRFEVTGDRTLMEHGAWLMNECSNPWGLFDMLGWSSEWVWDWSTRDYYEYSPSVDPTGVGDNPNLWAEGSRMSRGAHTDDVEYRANAVFRRRGFSAMFWLGNTTVRLVRTAVEPPPREDPGPVEPFWIREPAEGSGE